MSEPSGMEDAANGDPSAISSTAEAEIVAAVANVSEPSQPAAGGEAAVAPENMENETNERRVWSKEEDDAIRLLVRLVVHVHTKHICKSILFVCFADSFCSNLFP